MTKRPDRRTGGLAVYVTSHGFGHLNRTSAVLNRIPPDVAVTIKSHANLFVHWRERLKRPADLESCVSDAGAVNPPGDSAATDGRATLELAARVHAEATARLDDEVERLVKNQTAAVLCDAPAVPLLAARRAGVPGFLMTNFTWADIYAPYARALGGEAAAFVAELRRVYRQATAVFRIAPALRMSWLSRHIDAGMVVNRGRNRHAELRRLFGLPKADKLVYLYIGRYGQSDLDWSRLERFRAAGVQFIGYPPGPAQQPSNLHIVPSPDWPGGDLIASCDAVLAKAGYGTVCEAMASGTPIIYPPRQGFAEFRSLDRALRAWDAGVPISARFPVVEARSCARASPSDPARPSPLPRRWRRQNRPLPGRSLPCGRVACRRIDHESERCRVRGWTIYPRSLILYPFIMKKIVVHPAVERGRFVALQTAAPEADWVNAASTALAESAIPGADAFIGKITPALLARADRLVWVQSFTASLEHYMFPELLAHPCVLTNARGLFGDVIADQVMGYVLAFARNLHTYIRQQLEHRYEPVGGEAARVSSATGPGAVNAMDRATIYLPDARMGIVGMGGIGCGIAERAQAFGMSVRGVDRFPERVRAPQGVESVAAISGLADLLSWCDFAVIAAPQTPETRGLFHAGTLAHLRPSSYLINVGRGAIVVLDDLVACLRERRLAGAALDVYEVEPLPREHPLWDFPNVILTPHTAGYSPVIAARHLALLVENVSRFARGEPLRNVVDKALWF